MDDQGYVYVNDAENHRIQKFTSDGQFLAKWGWKSTAKKKAIRDGAFNYPMGIAVDGEGNIYVVDSNRMQRFNDHGMFVSKWGNWTWEFTGSNWNDSPTGDGEFVHPNGLAVDGVGNIYVVDSGNDRIQKFAADGTFLAKWGSRGIGDGEFQMPEGLAIDSSGNVYVTDFYMMLDSPQWFADDALARVAEWAGEKELREPATRVVICYSYDWREPVKDGFSA